jgi:hypothetical protein
MAGATELVEKPKKKGRGNKKGRGRKEEGE